MIQVELTLEELAVIAQALGIAEKTFSEMHAKGVALALVRGVCEDDKTAQVQHALDYHHKACQFADVGIKIKGIHDENIPVEPDLPKLEECYFCGNTGRWTAQVNTQVQANVSLLEDPWKYWCEFCDLPTDMINKELRRLS